LICKKLFKPCQQGLRGNFAATEEHPNMKDHEIYFCLAADGLLYNLGDHGDYEAADDTAKSLDLEVIWMFGEDTARSWMDTLAHHLREATP
jgi:hypothetical protein